MAHQINSNGFTAAVASDSDRKLDDVAIFSAPAVEVVLQWWAESNRRWTERDRLKKANLQTSDPV